jgi:MerR family transcriptional regulator/heat shock protein HspR
MRQTRGIYLISMVAETLDMHPQTLRKYERAGFVAPLRMGTLRTYTDEDVARLRLIKHFVDDLGLNLAGVEMALAFTGELLQMRTRLVKADGGSEAVADSVNRIDGMLARLGIKVVKRAEDGGDDRLGQGKGWFGVGTGEAVEFREPSPEDKKDARRLYA